MSPSIRAFSLRPSKVPSRPTPPRRHIPTEPLAGVPQFRTGQSGFHSNIRRYEAGTNQPNIDALRNLALALATSTDQLLFEPHERQPNNDLQHAFQAASTRLDPESQQHLKATLEGLLLAPNHEAGTANNTNHKPKHA